MALMETYDVAIVGGGPAGAVAALHLARAGMAVVVFEGKPEPGVKVCGGVLAAAATELLDQWGVVKALEGGVRLRRLVIRLPGHGAISCPLRPAPLAVSRQTLDAALLEVATAAGANVLLGHRVVALQWTAEGCWHVTANARGSRVRIRSRWVVGADGRCSPVARLTGARCQRFSQPWVAFQFVCPSTSASAVDQLELVRCAGGYYGLAPVHGERVNVCGVLVPKAARSAERFVELAGLSTVRALGKCRGAYPVGVLHRRPRLPALLLVGDALATFEPVTGQGMTAAMWMGYWAAELIRRHWKSPLRAEARLHARWRQQLWPKQWLSLALGRLLVEDQWSGWLADFSGRGLVAAAYRWSRVLGN